MKSLFPAAAALLALTACATTEDESASPAASTTSGSGSASAGTATTSTPAAPEYLRMAGASDLYEIQSSQMLLQSTQNADLRRFAQMMIQDHTRTTEQLASAAQAAGMTVAPPKLDSRQDAMVRELQAASGPARDRLYTTQQVAAHQEALNLHSGYASSGDKAELRAVAAQAAPVVQQHLAEIQRIAGQTG